MAFYALQPALLEEAWARLFLLPLLFVAFRSASGSATGRALQHWRRSGVDLTSGIDRAERDLGSPPPAQPSRFRSWTSRSGAGTQPSTRRPSSATKRTK